MSLAVQRRIAIALCGFLQRILPVQLQPWGLAVRNEIAAIPDDNAALHFAFESLCGLAPRAIATHMRYLSVRMTRSIARIDGGKINMDYLEDMVRRPRLMGIASAVGAVMLGLANMSIGGAPMAYLGINAGALVLGLVILALIGRITTENAHRSGAITLALALALFATPFIGERADGVARWVDLGPFTVQPSLVLLPLMIVGFARGSNALSMVGLLIAALALAIQPDRAMAGMLMAGLAMIAVMRRDLFTVLALMGSIIGFLAALVQADAGQAVPFVDQILYTSFDVSPLAGLAVLGGAALLIVPAIVGAVCDPDNRAIYYAFGAVWLAAIAAAALGNYPTPVVGHSGGAVLGYVLSLAMLPKVARSRVGTELDSEPDLGKTEPTSQNWRVACV